MNHASNSSSRLQSRRFILSKFFIGLLVLMGSTVLAPAACVAEGHLDLFFDHPFPLPQNLAVGDQWTYASSSVTVGNIIARIIARHELAGQTYFELEITEYDISSSSLHESGLYYDISTGTILTRDRRLYRVDDEGRTWQYDAATKSETLYWDIWIDPIPFPDAATNWGAYGAWIQENGYKRYILLFFLPGPTTNYVLEWAGYDRPFVFRGKALELGAFRKRNHSFLLEPTRLGPVGLELEGLKWLGLDSYTGEWRASLLDWGVSELYKFSFKFEELIISPQIGTIHSSYSPDPFRSYTRSLISYERRGRATSVEAISFGRLKERLAKPSAQQK